MNYESMETDFNKKYIKNISLKLINIKNRKTINGSFILTKDISEFTVDQWVAQHKSNGKFWTVYNFTLNGCQFIENSFGNKYPLAGIFQKEIRKAMPDLPRKCPLKKVGK